MIYYVPTRGLTLGIDDAGYVTIKPRLTVKRIQAVVSAFYGIEPREMTSDRRAREVARPRQIAMYLARETTPKSLPDIGRLFKRDHTTVMHAIRRVESLMGEDDDFAVDVELLRERLAA
jgi:chromosomal replication initiator protein